MRLGEYNWRDPDPRPHQDLNAARFFPHEYRPDVSDDIALVFLKEKVKLSKYVSKIGLAGVKASYLGRTAKYAGWGYSNLTAKYKPSVLQELNVKVVKEQVNHIFTVGGRGRGACDDDSGGPLTLKEGGTDILIGVIVSGDQSCDSSKNPTKHMRVSSYIKWIIGILNRQSSG